MKRMKKLMTKLILSACVFLLLTVPALGGMTNQRWDFYDVPLTTTTQLNPPINYNNNIIPEIDNNPYGDPSMAMYGVGLTHYVIAPGMMGNPTGAPSTIVMTIPNSPITDGWKWIEVTIGYMHYPDTEYPGFEFQLITTPDTTLTSSGSMGTSSYTANYLPFEELTWLFEVEPNPQSELVGILINYDAGQSAPYYIDFVEVTTACIPAPGAILLGSIGVGLVGWLRRRGMV